VFNTRSITAWNDYFPATNLNYLNSQTYTSRLNPSDSSIYVSNCLFKSITSSSNGGALYVTSATYFLVESTTFFSCKTSSSQGGAIYFSNTGSGQSVLHEVCGYDCCTTYSSGYSHYQFGYICVSNAISSKNNFNYSSITRTVNENSNSWHVLRLNYGKNCCPSINISLNKCHGQQFYCWPFVDSSSVTCLLMYSSFVDNIANWATLILFNAGGAKYEFKSCNILRNTQNYVNSEGTLWTNGNTMFVDSCILENNANIIFYQASSSYSITLSNCTVDSTSKTGNLITQNTVTKSFILGLKHLSTQDCHAGYDSIGTLTPIIQRSKKQLYYSCERLYYHSPLRDFFSLTFVLIFNFIYPCSSNHH
jgi:hypothetical protein